MKEAPGSSETSVLTRATRRNNLDFLYLNKMDLKVYLDLNRENELLSAAQHVSDGTNKQTNSVALSPRANYTDWLTATCRRNLVSRGQRGGSPTVVNLSFLDRQMVRNVYKSFIKVLCFINTNSCVPAVLYIVIVACMFT
jgi:hypothetical protein